MLIYTYRCYWRLATENIRFIFVEKTKLFLTAVETLRSASCLKPSLQRQTPFIA